MTVNRVSTGIAGLDKLMEGGLPAGSYTTVAGVSGAGKTILSTQFIWEGLEEGDRCLFISMEEPLESIRFDADLFGWDLARYEEGGSLKMVHLTPRREDEAFLEKVSNLLLNKDWDRIVIDSATVLLGEQGTDTAQRRRCLYTLYDDLRSTGATTLLTHEQPEEGDHFLTRYGVAEYIADGVLVLTYTSVGEEGFRNVEVRKMRSTDHSKAPQPFEVTDEGIVLREAAL